MSEKIVHITVRPEWKGEDADGSRCEFCGDEIYIIQYRLVLHSRAWTVRTKHVACVSCKDVAVIE